MGLDAIRRTVWLGGALGLVLGLGAVLSAAQAPAQSRTVHCYDPDRRIVQTKRPHKCEGRIVDESEARALREEISRERQERMGIGGSSGAGRPERRTGRSARLGSGFPVDREGHILTAYHVVDGCPGLEVQDASGERWPVQLLAQHTGADLALLHGERELEPFVFSDPRDIGVEPGRLAALGYPNEGLPTVRPRAVRGELAQANGGAWFQKGLVAFRAPVRGGGSGGPLVSEQGYLLGMVVGKVDTVKTYQETGEIVRDLSFAVSAPVLRKFLEQADVSAATLDTPEADANALTGRTLRVLCGAVRR